MTPEEQIVLRTFETRVRQLILKYRELETENRELYGMLDAQEKQIVALNNEKKRLQEAYSTLKLAKMMEIGDDDLKNAKTRISKLVKEVDKCIALLNV